MTSSEKSTTSKCDQCPMAAFHLNTIALDTETSESLIRDAFGNNIESALQVGGVNPDLLKNAAVEANDTPTVAAIKIRKVLGVELGNLDNHIAEHTRLYDLLLVGCKGPIKMRAEKDGTTITVTACNSPQQQDGESLGEQVYIERKR